MAERIPPTRIEQNRGINKFVEAYARWHRKADVQGVENIRRIKELLDQRIPVATFANHLGHLDGPFLPIEFKNISPRLREVYTPVMGEVIWRNHFTRILMHAYNGILMPSIRIRPEKEDARGWELREKRKESADKAAADDLSNGRLLGLFPEGSRSREKGLKKISPNIARYLYLAENMHVVPIGIWGSEKVFPPDTKLIFPTRFWHKPHMNVGGPISVLELEERVGESESKVENDQKLVDELMYEVAQLIPEEYRGYYREKPTAQ